MIYNERIIKAINMAYNIHKDEKDKIGVPYIFHPFKVAESIIEEESQFGGIKDCKALEDCVIIALLHDTIESKIEDTKRYVEYKGYGTRVKDDMIVATIRENNTLFQNIFGSIVADAINALTRREDETYNAYIDRVCKNPYAVKVKIHDIKHNMNVNRMKLLENKDKDSLSKRYIKAMEKLVKYEKL